MRLPIMTLSCFGLRMLCVYRLVAWQQDAGGGSLYVGTAWGVAWYWPARGKPWPSSFIQCCVAEQKQIVLKYWCLLCCHCWEREDIYIYILIMSWAQCGFMNKKLNREYSSIQRMIMQNRFKTEMITVDIVWTDCYNSTTVYVLWTW